MKIKKYTLLTAFILLIAALTCSRAPVVEYPEIGNRIVLGEFFTTDM